VDDEVDVEVCVGDDDFELVEVLVVVGVSVFEAVSVFVGVFVFVGD